MRKDRGEGMSKIKNEGERDGESILIPIANGRKSGFSYQ
jgi:hypothetical protein